MKMRSLGVLLFAVVALMACLMPASAAIAPGFNVAIHATDAAIPAADALPVAAQGAVAVSSDHAASGERSCVSITPEGCHLALSEYGCSPVPLADALPMKPNLYLGPGDENDPDPDA